MKPTRILNILAAAVICSCTHNVHTVTFTPGEDWSGARIALSDINPDLPRDWDDYSYVALEYNISTSQRFRVGFTTDDGYNELKVISYVPGAWNSLAIPLKYFTALPDAAGDLAATYNKPRQTGWINLGGSRMPLHGVDSIGFFIHRPIGSPVLQIRNVTLHTEDPGDRYLEKKPAIDRFGQQNFIDFPGKVKDLDELRAEWAAEDALGSSVERYGYSPFGGYAAHRVEATGFFHTKKIDGRWWLVDPQGCLFLSVGADCVAPGGGGNLRDYDSRKEIYEAAPPQELWYDSARGTVLPLGAWNLYRRYGEEYERRALDNIVVRMDRWGLNTISNWSSPELMALGRKAYLLTHKNLGTEGSLMGLADVYAPSFDSTLVASVKATVESHVDDPYLIGYFVGNEPSWVGQETRLCQLILDGKDRPVKEELRRYLSRNGDTDATRRDFILRTFDIFLAKVSEAQKRFDPNHLNLGMRFGNPDSVREDLLRICARHFEVFSFNCYALRPQSSTLDRALDIMDLPMLIGEFHFGTVDRGLGQSLWQVDSQYERGVAYRYYAEQAFSHPGIVGTAYFQWCDQDVTGRFDGENYNCGLVDVTDRPYPELTEAVSETSLRLFGVHAGTAEPFAQLPKGATAN